MTSTLISFWDEAMAELQQLVAKHDEEQLSTSSSPSPSPEDSNASSSSSSSFNIKLPLPHASVLPALSSAMRHRFTQIAAPYADPAAVDEGLFLFNLFRASCRIHDFDRKPIRLV
jgi:hypothetical protein